MKTTRREFGKVALGSALGAISGKALIGSKAQAQTRAAHASGVYHDGVMQLNQNESAQVPNLGGDRLPGEAVCAAAEGEEGATLGSGWARSGDG